MMDLAKYWDQLNAFNWAYDYGDDYPTWCANHDKAMDYSRTARTSPEHEIMYSGFWNNFYFGKPKPSRPSTEEEAA